MYFQKADVRLEDFLIECKVTANDYYILTQKVWGKVSGEALRDNMRIPLMQIQLRDGKDEIVIINIHDFLSLELDKNITFIGGKQPILIGDRMSFRVTNDFTQVELEEKPNEPFYFRQDIKLIDYNLHLVMLEWNDFLQLIKE